MLSLAHIIYDTVELRARLRTAPIRSRERQRADAQLLMTFCLAWELQAVSCPRPLPRSPVEAMIDYCEKSSLSAGPTVSTSVRERAAAINRRARESRLPAGGARRVPA